MKKGGEKISIEFIALSAILAFLIYFFLGVSYNLNFIEKALISLIALGLFYFSRKCSLYEFSLVTLTLLTTFISLEISFNIRVWLILIISLAFTGLFWIAYRKIKIKDKYALLLLVLFVLVWIILAFNVTYRSDWIMENYLTIPFIILIFILYKYFKLSNISYSLIFVYITLHIIGSHYTYSEVPFGDWMQTFFHFSRNHYDRIVHFSFGFLLAYPLREIAIRIANAKGFWALYIPVEFVLAFSCIYELIEWAIAVIFGGDLGVAYLGTQGDIWDAQQDMFMAGLGSLIAMIITFSIITYYNRKNYFKEIKESFYIKDKNKLGERILINWMKRNE